MEVYKQGWGGGGYGLHIAFIVNSVFFATQYHVHETNKWENRMGYMQTLPCSPVLDGDYGVYAMDCEMVSDTWVPTKNISISAKEPRLFTLLLHSCFKQINRKLCVLYLDM